MIAETLSDFLPDFGEAVTRNGSATVTGLFDLPYGESFGLVAGSDPVFRCPASVGIARGDTLLIRSVTYTVIGKEPDGTGWDVCKLEAA